MIASLLKPFAMVITLDKLRTDCTRVVNDSGSYNYPVHVLFWQAKVIGCREGELLDRSRWIRLSDTYFQLNPQKGNAPRIFDYGQIHPYFRDWIDGKIAVNKISSLNNLRRCVRMFSGYPNMQCGGKGCSSHRFRHLKMKQMFADGSSVAEIQAYMGLSSPAIVSGYIDSILYV